MMEAIVLPLLVKFSHVHQTVVHLLQTPDLFPSTPSSDLNRWFTEHCIPLHTHTQMHLDSGLQERRMTTLTYEALIFMCETLRFALRLSAGICRVTLYSVWRSSSSEMKQASCTRRFALTICSLSLRRLLTNTASLRDRRWKISRGEMEKRREDENVNLHNMRTNADQYES